MTKKLISVFAILALPGAAYADGASLSGSSVNIRGGYSMSLEEYPYAMMSQGDEEEEEEGIYSPVFADFGDGGFGQITFSNSDMFGNFGGEFSLGYLRVTGSDATELSACNFYDGIGLTNGLCMENGMSASQTEVLQGRFLLTRTYDETDFQLLGGLGLLDFSSTSNSEFFFPLEINTITRVSEFQGMGLVVGARKLVPLNQNSFLKLEGFAGAYWGDQDLMIEDLYDGLGFGTGSLSQSRSETVTSLDLTASLVFPLGGKLHGGSWEIGTTYSRLFNVMDTTNYNMNIPFDAQNAHPGTTGADFDALSFFVGLEFPI